MNDYSALKKLAEAASPGPWLQENDDLYFKDDGYTRHMMTADAGHDVCDEDGDDDWHRDNLKFIAAANPAAILSLIAENEALAKASYTAIDMTTAAADGFRDGVDSFKIRGPVLMEIFHDGGPEPFVCAIHGCICLEQVEAAQTDFRENMPDELDQGEGIYTFSFYYDNGQYDGYGRCEIAAGWGFDFVSYKPFEPEEVRP